MKILIIADEVWNDEVYGNNVLSNWFDGFDAEFASIYCGPGTPLNNNCTKYFQVTDSMMFKTLFFRGKAGVSFELNKEQLIGNTEDLPEEKDEKLYSFLKSIAGEPLRLIRDLIWLCGRYNTEKLRTFIQDFDPDVVYCTRLLTPKLLRLEKIVASFTSAPFVAFTADDEFSLNLRNFSPVFWLRRIYFRNKFKKHVKLYSHYFTFSSLQAEIYRREYGLETSTLLKSGDFNNYNKDKKINDPIKIIYAGRLYCNRWKVLQKIGDALKRINSKNIKMILEIYTPEKVSKKQKKVLNDGRSIFLKGTVKPEKLTEIYLNADIALHVESMDVKNRLITKYSFSTKIIDLLASSCAVMAIAWEKQAGFTYLKEHDAAFCISEYNDIYKTLKEITDNPDVIKEYARKAYNLGKKYHNREKIQKQLKNTFELVMENNKSLKMKSNE